MRRACPRWLQLLRSSPEQETELRGGPASSGPGRGRDCWRLSPGSGCEPMRARKDRAAPAPGPASHHSRKEGHTEREGGRKNTGSRKDRWIKRRLQTYEQRQRKIENIDSKPIRRPGSAKHGHLLSSFSWTFYLQAQPGWLPAPRLSSSGRAKRLSAGAEGSQMS